MSHADRDAILVRAYGGEVPGEARTILASLDDEERVDGLRRLATVLDALDGGNKSRLAADLGLSRQSLYTLIASWKRSGIAGLVPHESRAGRAMTVHAPLTDRAARLLQVAPVHVRNVDIVGVLSRLEDRRRARKEGRYGAADRADDRDSSSARSSATDGPEPARFAKGQRAAMQRAVVHARRKLAADPRYLRRHFGTELLIDYSATNVLIGSSVATAHLATVGVVLDQSSGLILGGVMGRLGDAYGTQRAAIQDALDFLAAEEVDRELIAPRSTRLTLVPAPDVEVDRRLVDDQLEIPELPRGRSISGHLLIQTIGPRIGRMILHPRFVRHDWDINRFRLLLLDADAAEAHWRRELLRHNHPILEALDGAGLMSTGVGHASISEQLDRASAALVR